MPKNLALRDRVIAPDFSGVGASARQVGFIALAIMLVSVQFSIAVAQTFFAVAGVAAIVALAVERKWPSAPPWASHLVLFAGWTLIAAGMSRNPAVSLADCKQLVLFLLVPITFEFARQNRSTTLTDLVLTAGAVSAVVGISQYSLFHFDNLGQRPRSTLGMYMTFAGLMMLCANVAAARLLFSRQRLWPALTIWPVLVALLLSFTRSAWIGAASGIGIQLFRRDLRLVAIVPLAVAIVFGFAPVELTRRASSIFDSNDATGRDRVAMLGAGLRSSATTRFSALGQTWLSACTRNIAMPQPCFRPHRTFTTCPYRLPPNVDYRRWHSGCGSSCPYCASSFVSSSDRGTRCSPLRRLARSSRC